MLLRLLFLTGFMKSKTAKKIQVIKKLDGGDDSKRIKNYLAQLGSGIAAKIMCNWQ
ncbi:MAG: hypothetical protein WDN26_00655 [Chitinophagaceae bacterium]